jgi:3-oxoacyl-[acyl-carrier protein] reductase
MKNFCQLKIKMVIDFTNRTALITGATRGIGKSIAICLHEAGANLILTGTNAEEIQKLNDTNQKKGISNIIYIQADFLDVESTSTFLRKLDEYDRIDICINNAGVNKVDEFNDTTLDDFELLHDVNLKAPYQILKVIGPKIIKNNYGRIVNVASIWSIISRPGRSIYGSSKNALVGLTKALAVEWASHNVLVNAVSPGFTLTELTKFTNTSEQLIDLEKIIPAKRMAETIEIARVVAFLCSDLNTYLTGQNIIVDGGYSNV